MEENTRENKMGTMPIGKLLANMAGPVMVSMLFQALPCWRAACLSRASVRTR